MKAFVKSRDERGLWLEDVPEPEMGINDVKIRVLATGICGTDLHIYEWDAWARSTIKQGLTIGHEFVGEVVAVGSNVTDIPIGQLVSGEGHVVCGRCRNCLAGRRHLCAHTLGVGVNRNGAFAEYIVLPMSNIWIHSPGVPHEIAAIFDPLGNAVHTALAFPVLGEDVLVTGAGPIGIMAAAVARHAGARHVVISDPNEYRRSLAQKVGVTLAVDPRATPLAEVQKQLRMQALVRATRQALQECGVNGDDVAAIALDTTGSSVVPVDSSLQPLDDYYLWCDHRAHEEASRITELALAEDLEAIHWCGNVYSHEWGFAKLLHWLRHNPDKRDRFATALEHCDMVAATLTGVTDPAKVKRSICAMGHKWMWNPKWDGLPPQSFLSKVDPLFDGIREKIGGEYLTSEVISGTLSPQWATEMGLKPGIPIPVGAFDAHWDAIGAGCREGDVVNVVGTSTCIIAMAKKTELVPGVCGVVPGSVHPAYTGIEAGLSATGDIFEAIARRAGVKVRELAQGLEDYRPGQTGLLRLSWDNGDRTVLVNPELGGITFGWNLLHTAQDELFAAIEGTAFHTRIILERMAEHGVPVDRVINAGGIPQNNTVLNQIYANVLGKTVLVPDGTPTSLGSGIFALLAAGAFKTIEEAQKSVCLPWRSYEPQPEALPIYNRLYALYRKAYFALGQQNAAPAPMGDILPELRRIASSAR